MRVLLIQAENDEGDLAEMRNGVLAGCAELKEPTKPKPRSGFWSAQSPTRAPISSL